MNKTEHDEIRARLQQQFRKTSSGRITGTYQGASRSTTDLANGRKLLRTTVASNTPPFVSAAGCGWRCTHEQLLSSRTCFLFTCAHRPLFSLSRVACRVIPRLARNRAQVHSKITRPALQLFTS